MEETSKVGTVTLPFWVLILVHYFTGWNWLLTVVAVLIAIVCTIAIPLFLWVWSKQSEQLTQWYTTCQYGELADYRAKYYDNRPLWRRLLGWV